MKHLGRHGWWAAWSRGHKLRPYNAAIPHPVVGHSSQANRHRLGRHPTVLLFIIFSALSMTFLVFARNFSLCSADLWAPRLSHRVACHPSQHVFPIPPIVNFTVGCPGHQPPSFPIRLYHATGHISFQCCHSSSILYQYKLPSFLVLFALTKTERCY